MSLIHGLSQPVVRGNVDLFSVPSTDTTVDYSIYASYQPLVNVNDSDSKIEFRIPANSNQYIDLNDSFLYIKVKVVNRDNTNITTEVKNDKNEVTTTAADVSTTNLFFHSLFSQVDMYFNSVLVSSSNNVYPYKAYLETLLSFGNDYKYSQGSCNLFYADQPNGECNDTNTGYKTRKGIIAGSKTFEMIDKLRIDLSNQSRYLLNDVNIAICLTRTSESFSLLANSESAGTSTSSQGYRVNLISAVLYIRRQILYPSVSLSHQKILESGQLARYPYRKTNVKYLTIASGNSSIIEENVFSSHVPTRVVIGFVASAAFNGDVYKNPFEFKPFGVNYLALNVNNMSMPIHPLNLNFNDSSYLLPYYLLFASTGVAGQDFGLTFDRYGFKKNNCLFSFDINQSASEETTLQLEKSGSVQLEIRFSGALSEAVHCIVFSEQPAILEIDKFRQIQQ